MGNWLRGLEPWGAMLLRLMLGAAMIYHGWDKAAAGTNLHGDWLRGVHLFCGYVAHLGLPAWLGYVSVAAELGGGVLLVLGLLTRFAAFMVVGNLLVALFAVNLHNGYAGSEYTLALIAMAMMLVTTGGGAASVDHRIGLN